MADRPERDKPPRWTQGPQKSLQLCVDKAEYIDYKDVAKLRRLFLKEERSCPEELRELAHTTSVVLTVAIKRARHLALLPFTSD